MIKKTLFTFDSNLCTSRNDIWYSNSKSDSMSDTATQKTVARIVEGWETWAGSDRTLGSIRLVEDEHDPVLLPVRARPWLLQACYSIKTDFAKMLRFWHFCPVNLKCKSSTCAHVLPVCVPEWRCEADHSNDGHIHQTFWELNRSAGGAVTTGRQTLGLGSWAGQCSFGSSVCRWSQSLARTSCEPFQWLMNSFWLGTRKGGLAQTNNFQPTGSELPWGHCFLDTLRDSPPPTPESGVPPSHSPVTQTSPIRQKLEQTNFLQMSFKSAMKGLFQSLLLPAPHRRVLPPPPRAERRGRTRRGCWLAALEP